MASRALIASLVIACGAFTRAQIYSHYDPLVVGRIILPNVTDFDALPATCRDFKAACVAEAKQDFETAFKIYESKYELCGNAGWSIDGHTHGSNDVVTFKTTPCGLRVAVKGLRKPKECLHLKLVSTGASLEECPGCFPRYYYFSNASYACYSEFVPGLHWSRIMNKNRDMDPAAIHRAKTLFLQGVAAIHVLRNHNLEHNDLTVRNMMIREETELDGERRLRLVLIDLGGSRTLDQQRLRMPKGRRLGANGFHPDMYMLACAFASRVYHGCDGCVSNELPIPKDDTTSFRFALTTIMHWNLNHTCVPDYKAIASLIHTVSHK